MKLSEERLVAIARDELAALGIDPDSVVHSHPEEMGCFSMRLRQQGLWRSPRIKAIELFGPILVAAMKSALEYEETV